MNRITDPMISDKGQVYSLAGLKRLLKEVTGHQTIHLKTDSTVRKYAAVRAATVPSDRKIS